MMQRSTSNNPRQASQAAPAKGIQVTEKALAKVRTAMAKEGISPEQGGLRLGVQGGGCSGLSYNIRFDTQPRERDRIFQYRRRARFRRSQVVHLPARHDPRLPGNADAAGIRLRESSGYEESAAAALRSPLDRADCVERAPSPANAYGVTALAQHRGALRLAQLLHRAELEMATMKSVLTAISAKPPPQDTHSCWSCGSMRAAHFCESCGKVQPPVPVGLLHVLRPAAAS